jgi:hypothetical protein
VVFIEWVHQNVVLKLNSVCVDFDIYSHLMSLLLSIGKYGIILDEINPVSDRLIKVFNIVKLFQSEKTE